MDYKHLAYRNRFKDIVKQPLFISLMTILATFIALFLWQFQQPLTHQVQTKPLILPTQVIKPHTQTLQWSRVIVKNGDTLTSILQRFGFHAKLVEALVDAGPQAKALMNLEPGQHLRLGIAHHQLQQLTYVKSANLVIELQKQGEHYTATKKQRQLDAHEHFVIGTIKHSLLQAASQAKLPTSYVYQIAKIFAWDIDFHKDIRPGDQFIVIYEDFYLGDEKVGEGPILAIEFINQDKTYTAIRYKNTKGHTDYYNPNGFSLHKALLRAPLKFNHISSRFTYHRFHPILGITRPHYGVDYAAKMGTPVIAAGDGKVILAGRDGGYGNTIKIKHNRKYMTLYAHLYRFAKGIKRGTRVKQGQVIGYVGRSGLATGPHCHYEIRKNNHPVSPLKIRLPNSNPIAKRNRDDFLATSKRLLAELQLYQESPSA